MTEMAPQMMILNKSKIDAMKAGDRTRKDILVMIINEANVIAKNDGNRPVVDDDVLMALNRTIKKARETRDILIKNGATVEQQENEIAVAQSFLPQQMTRTELKALIEKIVEGPTVSKQQRGLVMKTLNGEHKGRFDAAMANEVVSEMMA